MRCSRAAARPPRPCPWPARPGLARRRRTATTSTPSHRPRRPTTTTPAQTTTAAARPRHEHPHGARAGVHAAGSQGRRAERRRGGRAREGLHPEQHLRLPLKPGPARARRHAHRLRRRIRPAGVLLRQRPLHRHRRQGAERDAARRLPRATPKSRSPIRSTARTIRCAARAAARRRCASSSTTANWWRWVAYRRPTRTASAGSSGPDLEARAIDFGPRPARTHRPSPGPTRAATAVATDGARGCVRSHSSRSTSCPRERAASTHSVWAWRRRRVSPSGAISICSLSAGR